MRKSIYFHIFILAVAAVVFLALDSSIRKAAPPSSEVFQLGLILFALLNVYLWLPGNVFTSLIWSLSFGSFAWLNLALAGYILQPGVEIESHLVHALIQTNIYEASEYLPYWQGLLCLLLILSIHILVFLSVRRKKSISGYPPALLLVSLFGYGLAFGTQKPLPITFIQDSVAEYHHEFANFRRLREKRISQKTKVAALKKESGEVYLVLIGESLNKNHMSLYGYFRETTPKLSAMEKQGQLFVHRRSYSVHTHSQPVLKQALTAANQYNNSNFWESPSLIETLNAAGIYTAWISNQTAYGPWDNLITILAEESDFEVRTNNFIGKRLPINFDGELLPLIENRLKNVANNAVIFVHLLGNHADYCSRFPPNFTFFESLDPMIDCYDNSVRYNDHVVSAIFELAGKYPQIKAAIYLADHSEDVLGRLGHDAGKFTPVMTEIPLVFQFSDDYILSNLDKINHLQRNISRPFVNDFLFDTVLGMVGVNSIVHTPKGDLFSAQYSGENLQTTGRTLSRVEEKYIEQARQLLNRNNRGPRQTLQ